MAHVHGTHETVVEERSGVSVLAILLIVLLVGLLIWFIAFSGMVIDRGERNAPTKVENNDGDDTTIINPGSDTGSGTSSPAPATSP